MLRLRLRYYHAVDRTVPLTNGCVVVQQINDEWTDGSDGRNGMERNVNAITK